VSFLIGSLMLFDRNEPAFRLVAGLPSPARHRPALFSFCSFAKGLAAQRLAASGFGKEMMIGRRSRRNGQSIKARACLHRGEYWNARERYARGKRPVGRGRAPSGPDLVRHSRSVTLIKQKMDPSMSPAEAFIKLLSWLIRLHSRRVHRAANDPYPARIRAWRRLPSRQASRHQGPGLVLLIPVVDRLVKLDLR